jgi:hypothetical protein
METMMGFAGLAITTLVALFTALGLQILLLRAAIALMQPATARQRDLRPAIEQGARLVARAFRKAH